MKKGLIALAVLALCGISFGGEIGKPRERLALPAVQGSHLICIWDETARAWLSGNSFEQYDHSGSYSFQVPEWGRWYWVGLWDEQKEQYAFGKWIGHFIVN